MSDIKVGDYVLGTKFSDGDPGDPWAVGIYDGLTEPCREVDARFYISRNPEQPFMVYPGSVRYKKPAEYDPLGQVDFTGFDATG